MQRNSLAAAWINAEMEKKKKSLKNTEMRAVQIFYIPELPAVFCDVLSSHQAL